jgi:hypothetical protein
MFWTVDFDDHNGSFCNQGRFPLINTVKTQLKSAIKNGSLNNFEEIRDKFQSIWSNKDNSILTTSPNQADIIPQEITTARVDFFSTQSTPPVPRNLVKPGSFIDQFFAYYTKKFNPYNQLMTKSYSEEDIRPGELYGNKNNNLNRAQPEIIVTKRVSYVPTVQPAYPTSKQVFYNNNNYHNPNNYNANSVNTIYSNSPSAPLVPIAYIQTNENEKKYRNMDLNFKCEADGLYPDRSTGCIVFFQCIWSKKPIEVKAKMICPDRTIFNRYKQVCDWEANVKC